MPIPTSCSYHVQECPGGTWGVQCSTWNRERALGIDHHWTSREMADRALSVYEEHPELHGHSSSEQVLSAYDDLLSHHRERMESWVQEAAADLGMDPEVVWYDVQVSYLTCEVPGEQARRDLARGQGISPTSIGLTARPGEVD